MAQKKYKRKDTAPVFEKNKRTLWQQENLLTAQYLLSQGATRYNLADTKTAGINRKGDCLRRIR